MSTQSAPSGPIRLTSTAVLSAVFVVIFASAAVVAKLNYPAEAASMPLFIGGIGTALSFLQLIVELRASRGAHEEQIDLRKDLPIYLWVWAFVGAVVAFGFVIAAPIMLFAYLRWRSRESWWLSVLLSAAIFGILYGLFETVLGVPLFEGLVTPMIEDWLTAAGWLKS
jgi:tripartite tricarboxylate transporter TctB family protein